MYIRIVSLTIATTLLQGCNKPSPGLKGGKKTEEAALPMSSTAEMSIQSSPLKVVDIQAADDSEKSHSLSLSSPLDHTEETLVDANTPAIDPAPTATIPVSHNHVIPVSHNHVPLPPPDIFPPDMKDFGDALKAECAKLNRQDKDAVLGKYKTCKSLCKNYRDLEKTNCKRACAINALLP